MRGVYIVVVGGEAPARALVANVLAHYGALVAEVASAQGALTMLGRVRPDVLIIDVTTPDGALHGLLEHIAGRRPGDIPAVALTAGEPAAELNSGTFQRYLKKPIDPDQLCAAISTLVRWARRRPA